MDRYVVRTTKRKKLNEITNDDDATATPPTFKDFWALIASHLDWPELYAFTKTSRMLRKVAFPLLKQKADPLRQRVIWQMIEYKRREDRAKRRRKVTHHIWNIKGFTGEYATLSHPRLVNNTTFFGLLQCIFKDLEWRYIWHYFGIDYARFCRIVGIYVGHRYVCWSLE